MSIEAERDVIAAKAREWASHYPESSDGRNTFILFAEWVERRSSAPSCFDALRAAYERGAIWRETNGSLELMHKASYDYADKATSPYVIAPELRDGGDDK